MDLEPVYIEVKGPKDVDIYFDKERSHCMLTMPDGLMYRLTAESAESLAFQILEQLKIYED